MNKIYYILTIVMLCSLSCKAQFIVNNTRSKGKTITYVHIGKPNIMNSIIVYNEKNQLHKVKPIHPGKNPDSPVVKIDEIYIRNIISGTFSKARLKELRNEKALQVNMKFNDIGKVMEVTFAIGMNSKLTAYELEEIENGIKKQVTASFYNESLKGSNYSSFSSFFDFGK